MVPGGKENLKRAPKPSLSSGAGFQKAESKNDDPDLVASLHVDGYCARPERAVVITIEGLDWNCPQHIPVRLTREELEPHLTPLKDELARLTAENAALKAKLPPT